MDVLYKDFGTVAVGARMGGAVDPVFVKSYLNLALGGLRDGDKVLPPAIELPHHWAANVVAREFLTKTECDTLLMLDDDMTFGGDALERLRSNADSYPYGMVQGLCCSAKAGHGPLLLAEAGDYYSPMRPEPGDGVVEVGMVGLAFTLIRRSTFQSVADNKQAAELFFAWGSTGTGEDAWFCKAARRAGIRFAVDCKVSIGHRVPVNVTWDAEKDTAGYHTYRNSPFLELLSDAQNTQDKQTTQEKEA
ncbi:hypothetical protein KJ662_05615 [Patescibacteria group bacterium]|nr:hypothetical protein [Patescibacteria group bacterium]MBU1685698.1 hypothetical protein [Patescibacteria group bacterium]